MITVEQGMPTTAVQLSFTDFNDGGARANELNRDMQKAGVRVSHPEASVAQDLEPEYVAFSADSKKSICVDAREQRHCSCRFSDC